MEIGGSLCLRSSTVFAVTCVMSRRQRFCWRVRPAASSSKSAPSPADLSLRHPLRAQGLSLLMSGWLFVGPPLPLSSPWPFRAGPRDRRVDHQNEARACRSVRFRRPACLSQIPCLDRPKGPSPRLMHFNSAEGPEVSIPAPLCALGTPDNGDDFMNCPVCGLVFDCRDLDFPVRWSAGTSSVFLPTMKHARDKLEPNACNGISRCELLPAPWEF
jgi:hypothetical protein